MHRQQAYYVRDPATGQAIPVARSYSQASYAAPAYAQGAPTYAQPQGYAPAQGDARLYASSPAPAQQIYNEPPRSYAQPGYPQPAYAQPGYAQPGYAQPAYPGPYSAAPPLAASSSGTEDRGLFSFLRKKRRPQPIYAAAPQGVGGPYVAAPGASYAAVNPAPDPGYTLDAGDKLRVVVFGQDGITNSYLVGADGNVNLPLVGNVPARGFTTAQLAQMISERLKQGYVREPHVSVEVEAYRPFFILGEVTTPGQYPYVASMTAETAIAIAGGFSPRADKKKVQLTRNAPGQMIKGDVPLSYPLRPGDTILVKERWF